jgi:hypothetical protein
VAGLASVTAGLSLLRKLALEMTFNIFTTERVSCFGQDYRIDDLITGKLSGDKCSVLQQFLISEFYFLAAFNCFDPLVVWHSRLSSAEISISERISCSVEIAEPGTSGPSSPPPNTNLTYRI